MPKYNSVSNIPAKLFFDILESKNFDLLEPEENEEGLEQVFSDIYDDYFVKCQNPKSNEYLELSQTVAFLNYKIESVKQVVDFLSKNKTTKEMRLMLLESLIYIGINIDLQADFSEEVQRILQVELGILENEVSFAQIDLQNMTKEKTDSVFNFYESLIGLESVHERNLDDEMVLAKFIEYERIAIKKIEIQKQKSAKFNT